MSTRGPYRKEYLCQAVGGWVYKRGVPTRVRPLVGRSLWSLWLGSFNKLTRTAAATKARALASDHDALVTQLEALTENEKRQIIAKGGFYSWNAARLGLYADHFVATVSAELRPDSDADEETQGKIMLEAHRARNLAGSIGAEIKTVHRTVRKLQGTAERPLLFDLVELWEKSRPMHPKRSERVRLYVNRFVKIVGDLEPAAVRRDHVVKYRDKLQEQGNTRENIDQHLAALKTLFAVGVSEGKLAFDPADGVKARHDANSVPFDNEPEDFTADEIRRIFAALEGESEDFQWTVRLLTYHGMRGGEVCFLRCSDVLTMYGVPVLDIHNRKGGRVKNKWSVRQIPIHPKCRGIMAYAEKVRASHPEESDPWLFMSYYPTKTTTREHSFQNDANGRFLREKVGITDRRPGKRQYTKSIHSLRHRFSTLCREVEMPDAIKYSLKGHKLGKGEGGNYGEAPSLKVRAKWIAKVDPLKG